MRNVLRSVIVLVVTAVVAGTAVVVGNAAQLQVDAGQLSVASASAPCTGTATATPEVSQGAQKFRDLRVTLPTGCSGDVQVAVTASGGTVGSFSGSPAADGSVLVDNFSGGFRPADISVSATLQGWTLPVVMGAVPPTGPVYPADAVTVVTDIRWTLVTNNPVQACFAADVTTASTTPVPWRLEVDLTQPPFNGATTGYSFQGNDGWLYQQSAATPAAGYMQISGAVGKARETVVAGTTYEVQVCNYGLPPGVQTPSAYTVSSTQGTWTNNSACVQTTVTGNGTSQFYFGWTAVVDLRAAASRVGRTSPRLELENAWQQTWTPAPDIGPNVYRVASQTSANLAGTQSYTFSACAMRN